MRKVVLSMQTSLDGFVEGENGDMSFMNTQSTELWDGVFKMVESVDTLILGRVMFPGYRDYWKSCLSPANCTKEEHQYAKWADKTQHIVFSKTLKDAEWQNTKIVSSPVAEEVKQIKEQKQGGDIYVVGGAMLARTVIDAGLVDEYRITINPTLVVKGKSIWSPLKGRHKLETISVEPIKSGEIVVRYRAIK